MKFSLYAIIAFATAASAAQIIPSNSLKVSNSESSEKESYDRSLNKAESKKEVLSANGQKLISKQAKLSQSSQYSSNSTSSSSSSFEAKYQNGRIVGSSSSSSSSSSSQESFVKVSEYHSKFTEKTVFGEYLTCGDKAITVIDVKCDESCMVEKRKSAQWGTYSCSVNNQEITVAVCVDRCTPELQKAAPVCVFNCEHQTVYKAAEITHSYYKQIEEVLYVFTELGEPEEKFIEFYKTIIVAEESAPKQPIVKKPTVTIAESKTKCVSTTPQTKTILQTQSAVKPAAANPPAANPPAAKPAAANPPAANPPAAKPAAANPPAANPPAANPPAANPPAANPPAAKPAAPAQQGQNAPKENKETKENKENKPSPDKEQTAFLSGGSIVKSSYTALVCVLSFALLF